MYVRVCVGGRLGLGEYNKKTRYFYSGSCCGEGCDIVKYFFLLLGERCERHDRKLRYSIKQFTFSAELLSDYAIFEAIAICLVLPEHLEKGTGFIFQYL